MVTSSAVVGSSAISRRGSLAMAMAIIARWRMPPDNSCGKAGRGAPDRGCRLVAAARPAARARRRQRPVRAIASAIWSPMRCTGLRLLAGPGTPSPCAPPRSRLSSASASRRTSSALDAKRPPATLTTLGSSPSRSPESDLPEPDSPTMARVSPGATLRESRTAPAAAPGRRCRSRAEALHVEDRARPGRRGPAARRRAAGASRRPARAPARAMRIEGVAQRVAEQVTGEDGDAQREKGQTAAAGPAPWCCARRRSSAPRRARRHNAQPEKGQADSSTTAAATAARLHQDRRPTLGRMVRQQDAQRRAPSARIAST